MLLPKIYQFRVPLDPVWAAEGLGTVVKPACVWASQVRCSASLGVHSSRSAAADYEAAKVEGTASQAAPNRTPDLPARISGLGSGLRRDEPGSRGPEQL